MTGMNAKTGEVKRTSNKNLKKLLATTTFVAAGALAFAGSAHAQSGNGVWELSGDGFTTDASAANRTDITNSRMESVGRGDLDLPESHTVNLYQDDNARFVAIDTENDPTDIHGRINAQGTLFILDENGIFFGENAVLNVGSIVASTGQLMNESAFLNGAGVKLGNFSNDTNVSVENNGVVNVSEAGLAAFVSPFVTNNGVINAKMGKVVMAAGETVTVDMYGDGLFEVAVEGELSDAMIENKGAIEAQGGTVQMTAKAAKDVADNIINMEGVVDVASVEQKGGKIILSGGDQGTVKVDGTLDASGTDGGDIEVDGENTFTTADSEIKADATSEDGAGGNIILWGRRNALYTGLISALGKNGFVETSGGKLGVWGDVNLSPGGEWLLDPTDITIVDGSMNSSLLGSLAADVVFSPDDHGGDAVTASPDSWVWIGDENINTALNNGVDVTFETHSDGTRAGDITLRDDASILKTGGADSTLSFLAHNDIILDGTIDANGSGKLHVNLLADKDDSGAGDIHINNSVNTNNGNLSATAGNDLFVNADIKTQDGSITLDAGHNITVGHWDGLPALAQQVALDTFGGEINIDAGNDVRFGGHNGNLVRVKNTNGDIKIKAGDDVRIRNTDDAADSFTLIKAINGDITIDAGIDSAEGILEVTAGDGSLAKIYAQSGDVKINADALKMEGGAVNSTYAEIIGNGIEGTFEKDVIIGDNARIDAIGGALHLSQDGILDAVADSIKNNLGGTIEIDQNEGGSIQNAIDAINNSGDGANTINVGDGTFYESIKVDEPLTLLGSGRAKTFIDTSGLGGYGMQVTADDVTLRKFTLQDDGTSTYGIKATGDNLDLIDLQVRGFSKSEVDLNGVTNANLTRVIADGQNSAGVGIALSNVTNATLTDVTTKGNNWGGIGLYDYSTGPTTGGPTTGVTLDVDSAAQLMEDNPIYIDAEYGFGVTDLELPGFDFAVRNPNHRPNGSNFTFFQRTEQDAIDFSVGLDVLGVGSSAEMISADTNNHVVYDNEFVVGVDSSNVSMYINPAIKEADAGGTIHVRDGEFGGNIIVDKDNLTLLGTGYTNTTTVNVAAGGTGFTVTADDVTVDGFGFEADIDGSGTGVLVDGANNAFINENGFFNLETGVFGENAFNLVVRDNIITGSALAGVYIKDSSVSRVTENMITGAATGVYADNAADIWVYTNEISDASVAGVHLTNTDGTGYGNDADIWNNTINSAAGATGVLVENSDYATVGAHGTNQPAPDGLGIGNVITGGDKGIVISNSDNAMVRYNTVNDTAFGSRHDGISVTGSADAQVWDNVVNNSGWDGIYVGNSTGTDILRNTVTGADQVNITVLAGSTDTLVEGNTVSGAQRGILVKTGASGTTVSGNVVYNQSLDGIHAVGDDDLTISGNFVGYTDAGDTAGGNNNIATDDIYIAGSDNAQITGNFVTETGGNGIYNNGSNDTILSGNTIANVGQSGILVNPSTGVTVSGNTLTGPGVVGIDIQDSDGTLVNGGNSVADFTTGISVTGSDDVRVHDNDVTNGATGIYAANAADIHIFDNTVTGAGVAGIHVKDSDGYGYNGGQDDIDLWNNTINSGDGATGILIENSAYATIGADDLNPFAGGYTGGNKVTGGAAGIVIKDSDHAQVIFSTIDNVDGNGIKIEDGAHVKVATNKVGTNGGADNIGDNGIYIDGSNNILIHSNEVRDSYHDSIRVTGASESEESSFGAKILGNTVSHSGDEGIEVHGAGAVLIANNDVSYSGYGYGGYYGRNNDSGGKYGSNGIHVGGAYGAEGSGVGGYEVIIVGNTVDTASDDGIEVHASGATYIHHNEVNNAGYGDDGYYFGADQYGADGIAVREISGTAYDGNAVKIVHNDIDRTGDDGIEVADAGRTLIEDNDIFNTGAGRSVEEGPGELYEGEGDYGYGADGIHVRDVTYKTDEDFGRSEEGNYYNYAVNIIDNEIDVTGDDGIEVVGASSVLIADNEISHAGYGDGEYYGGGDFFGADGIHVSNVYYEGDSEESAPDETPEGRDSISFGIYGGEELREYSVVIENNEIDVTGDDGIQVLFSGDTRIATNEIDTAGDFFGERILGGDGISVLTIGDYGEAGEGYTDIEIVDNTVENSIDDGIEAIGTNINVLVDGNDVTDSGDNGIALLGLDGFFGSIFGPTVPSGDVILTGYNSTVTDNTLENSGNAGLLVGGTDHNDVIVAGNSFIDNPIGAEFQSGEIDLTGETNTFTGGEVGMYFNPAEIYSFFPFPPSGAPEEVGFGPYIGGPSFPFEPEFASMSLVGNTIGTTTFSGQSEYYVELDNGAFFAPGTPTVLNGLNATYDGINPAAQGGFLSQAQFDQIEAGIYHFTDESSLGLFFFGAVPQIDQEDLFRSFGLFDGQDGGLNVTITGLPGITQGELLAQISPASGEEGTAESLAALEPAAGGQETNCWSDAVNAAGSGQSVSFSFGDEDPETVLNNAAGCQTGGI